MGNDLIYIIKYYYRKIINIFYSVIYGVENIILWTPIIWKDKQWDSYYLFVILNKKLKCMERFFESDKTYGVYSKKEAKEIRTARILTDRIINHEYLSNALFLHEQKYPDYLRKFFNFVECKNNPNFQRLEDLNSEEQKKDFRKCGKHAEYMENQDLNYLFDYLKKHIKDWWD